MKVLELSKEQQEILDRAVTAGLFKDRASAFDEAVRLLGEDLKKRRDFKPSDLSKEEWIRRFREWANSHPPTGNFVDDSRDSIYSNTIDDPR